MKPRSIHFPRNEQCAHAWAHQHIDAGHASNIFFEGPVIYSYGHHFPIACMAGDIVFFTDQKSSVSTSVHKNQVRSAISHKQIVFVHDVPIHDPLNNEYNRRQNLEYWTNRLSEIALQFKEHPRRKSLRTLFYNVRTQINEFLDALGIQAPVDLKPILDAEDIQEMAAQTEAMKRAQREEMTKQDAIRNKKFLGQLRQWEQGKVSHITMGGMVGEKANLAYLRWDPINRRVETSKDIQVPETTAHECWLHIQSVLGGNDIEAYSILGFMIDEISPKGVKAGCHFIPMKQIEKIASLLGWLEK